jgi:uncharacterized protein YhbP (UPF0306 family)
MAAEPVLEVPEHVLQFLGEQQTLTLATASPAGVPHAGTFLFVNDGPSLYFWSRPDTTIAKQVARNPLVSFTVDSYTQDLSQTKGVQGRGEARVLLSGEEVARVAALFGDKFPDLSPGNTMSISFFRIAPTDIEFIDNSGSGADTPGDSFGAEFHRERAYSLFTDLPIEDIDTIGAGLGTTEVPAGETIVRQGGPADKFFIVVEGELEVMREGDEGKMTVETLGPGHFYGEMAIVRDTPRTATVTAKSAARLLTMERETFIDLVAQSLGTTGASLRERVEALGG